MSIPVSERRASATSEPARPWRLALTAGIGSGFGYILAVGLFDFIRSPHPAELIVIVLVLIAIWLFFEPLFGQIKGALGVQESHAKSNQKGLKYYLAIFIVVISGVSHAVLEATIKEDIPGALLLLLQALMIPGGITYAWARAIRRRPSRCAQAGALWGAILGISFFFVMQALGVWSVVSRPNSTLNYIEAHVIIHGLLPWAVLGYVGGKVIDKRFGLRPSRAVGVAMMATIIVCDIFALFLLHTLQAPFSGVEFFRLAYQDFATVGSWSLGLIVLGASADLAFRGELTYRGVSNHETF